MPHDSQEQLGPNVRAARLGPTRSITRGVYGVILAWLSSVTALLAQPATTAPANTLEQGMLDAIKAMPVGNHTIGDITPDDAFLRRVADRSLRENYQRQLHIVVRDEDYQGSIARAPKSQAPIPDSQPAATRKPSRSRNAIFVIGIAAALIALAAALRSKSKRGQTGAGQS